MFDISVKAEWWRLLELFTNSIIVLKVVATGSVQSINVRFI